MFLGFSCKDEFPIRSHKTIFKKTSKNVNENITFENSAFLLCQAEERLLRNLTVQAADPPLGEYVGVRSILPSWTSDSFYV
jgi:hypothetical protein